MQYTTDNLHHMFKDEPRESWLGIVKPLVLKEESNEDESREVTLNNYATYGFSLNSLSPDYRCKFNVGDIIYFEGLQWMIVTLPILDNRHSIDDIKSRGISIIEGGMYLGILRPNPNGIDGKLYLNNTPMCNLSYNDSIGEYEISLVPENEISEEMIKFKEWMLDSTHRVDLLW